MKRTLFVMFVIVLLGSFAFAQTNEATVQQVGNENDAAVTQTGSGNDADVEQFGKNYSRVNQTGEDNDAIVKQGKDGSPVTNFGPPPYSGAWIRGAYIDQEGNDNTAEISMWRGDNGARIYQFGHGNEAYQDLDSRSHKTTDWNHMGAHISQVGDANYGKQQTVSSFGNFGVQGMIIDQLGSSNKATQYSIGGMNSTIEIFQEGNGNMYTGFQPQVAAILDLPWVLKPAGDFAQYQRGEYSTVSIDVLGSNNITAQYQESDTWGGGYNVAEINIVGNSNQAAQAQLGTNNTARIGTILNPITGDYNKAGIKQQGDWHSGVITQVGNTNKATIIQSN